MHIWLILVFTHFLLFSSFSFHYAELSPNSQNNATELFRYLRKSIHTHLDGNDFKKVFGVCILITVLSLRIANFPQES